MQYQLTGSGHLRQSGKTVRERGTEAAPNVEAFFATMLVCFFGRAVHSDSLTGSGKAKENTKMSLTKEVMYSG
jgi:hypothetical protein